MRNSFQALAAAVLAVLSLAGCRKAAPPPAPPARTITTAGGIEMVLIPAGEFLMGDEAGEEDERPAHRVRLGAFYMDRREVTQRSFQAVLGTSPSRFKGPDNPVERVGWLAAARYCNERSRKEGLPPCYDLQRQESDFRAGGYRLPTEAEWEYACRAGTTGPYSFPGGEAALGEYAWFRPSAGGSTHPVGLKKPNPWGLYDMHGNVAEWCNDYYVPTAYASSAGLDPRGPSGGDYRVLRGGSWRTGAEVCRSAARVGETPGAGDVCLGYEAYGFRCVRKAAP
jgi:formylglycine-generating enzyme required for sulfatase activity